MRLMNRKEKRLFINDKTIQMKYSLLVFAIFIISCGLKKREPIKHERGLVMVMQYSAEINASGSGTGMAMDSKGGISPTFTHVSLHESEKYTVVFRCEHGVVFSINSQDLFAKLNEKDSVLISYYELINNDGDVKDLEFVDANNIKDGSQF